MAIYLIWLKSYNRLRILENFECFECINVLKIQKNFQKEIL